MRGEDDGDIPPIDCEFYCYDKRTIISAAGRMDTIAVRGRRKMQAAIQEPVDPTLQISSLQYSSL